MRLISWNVNGLRACVNKGCFLEFLAAMEPDALCVQETKLQEGQIQLDTPLYHQYWACAEKKGYSGTAVFTKREPISVFRGFLGDWEDREGRALTLEFPEYYLLCVYTPNAQEELKRIDFRLDWEQAFRAHIAALEEKKPVVVCGDLNVAHQEIDLARPAANRGNPGFSDEERAAFSRLLEQGMTDTFRFLNPEVRDAYSWWSFRARARENNVGWRIDYFLVSNCLRDKLKNAFICPEILGSDHCPVGLDIAW